MALPSITRIEEDGHTFSQMPQPIHVSVTRIKCRHASGGVFFVRAKNCRCAARSSSVTSAHMSMVINIIVDLSYTYLDPRIKEVK
ncbi:MAG: hypothetical protein KHW62_06315 [Clostridiales bacterium]|nr:hypothetical protein [Clostridiales bacterium]